MAAQILASKMIARGYRLSSPLFHCSHRRLSALNQLATAPQQRKKCFMFPGMGSQYPGMCRDLCNDFPYISTFLEECNELLGFSITDIMWNSDAKELEQASFAGTSIVIHSMCIWNILQREYEIETVLTDDNSSVIGHSTGEYSALRAANVFGTFKDALNMTYFYAKCMQRCSSTEQAMYAVIAEDIDIALLESTVSQHNVDIANINTSNQIIISGLKTNIEAAVAAFNASKDVNYKVRGKYLATGGAYHSRHMRPMSDVLKDAFHLLSLNKKPKCDLYMNVIGGKYDCDIHEDIASIMAKQLYDQVHWHECIQNYFAANECEDDDSLEFEYDFIEIGPKNVLRNMVQNICKYHKYDQTKDVHVMSIGTTNSIDLIKTIL
eukprot:162520_1